jgi:hypothetical protein
MPCLVGLLALIAPRVTIVLLVLLSDYLGNAYETWVWPFLGFLCLPTTTLAYAWAHHSGGVEGWRLVIVVLAVLIDLGIIGAGSKSRGGKP